MKKLVIGMLAHVDAGKTTLSESILYTSGAIRKLGRVDNKDAFLDNNDYERQRGITIFSKQAVFTYKDLDVTLLDTPGHVDFSAEMERTLWVLDYAVLVINGMDGVQGHTETLWGLLKRLKVPVFIFVNKMDQQGTDRHRILEQLKNKLSSGCVDFDRLDYEELAVCNEEALEQVLEEGIVDDKLIGMVFGSLNVLSGRNGSGKSTLLEALAVSYGFNSEGGTKNYSFSTFDSHSELYNAIRISKGFRKAKWGYFLRAESFYNVATKELEYSDWAHPSEKYHEKSHGESFLALTQNHLRPNGLYLFDEPEAALSPQRQLTLLMEIYSCAKEGSQFIIVTHSPILLGIPDAQILSFDDGIVHKCEYEDTQSYKVTEMFINNRKILLERLLSE